MQKKPRKIYVPKVVITGYSCMCGLGLTIETVWKNLLAGKSQIKKFTKFELTQLPCDSGLELPEEIDKIFAKQISAQNRSQMTRATKIAICAAASAIEHAKLLPCEYLDRARVGVILGSAGPGEGTSIGAKRLFSNMVCSPASWISLRWKFIGPSYVVSAACSSGVYALHVAHLLITSGTCDVVLCGASDSSLSQDVISDYCAMLALCEDEKDNGAGFKPFDIKHQGFVIGEGAGMIVMESRAFAEKRNANIFAELHLPGLCSETYNLMAPAPHGHGMSQAMRSAISNADLDVSEVDYVNAHGIALDMYDRLELEALVNVFGKTKVPPVSSTKPMTGHCLAASAAIEVVLCCKAIATSVLPPTINLKYPLPGYHIDHVMDSPRVKKLKHVMSNSFSFGGRNGVCILSAP